MSWLVKNIFFIVSVIIAVQLIRGKANPLSEDLLEVNSTPPEQSADADNQKKFMEKCSRASGGKEAFENMLDKKQNLNGCLSDIFHNASALQSQLYAGYETGILDEVLQSYCNRMEDFLRCYTPFMKSLEKCAENDDEKKFLHVISKFLRAVSEHVCYRHGERIKNLMEHGGLDCLEQKVPEFQRCFFQTTSLKNVFQSAHEDGFIFNNEKCNDVTNYESCVTERLKDCNTTSASDFHVGLFKAIKRILPCDFKKNQNLV